MDELLEEVKELYCEAERQIKATEYIKNEFIVPAVNELRHAGFHLVKYENATTNNERLSELHSAKNHSKRAIYDAVEVRALYIISEFNEFRDDYRNVVISEIVPTFNDILAKIRELKELILDEINKEEKIDDISEMTNYLLIEVEKLYANRALLNEKILKRRQQSIFYIIIAIVGLSISITLAVNTFFFPNISTEIDTSVSERIDELDHIQSSLETLSKYVNMQKDTLFDMRINIETLNSEKDNLEKIIETKKESVDAIMSRYVKESSSMKLYEIIVSFITGALASLVASLIINYFKEKKLEKNLG